ncbi:hypothetical protein E5206_06570 [Arthrobacter sp. PAMC25564]|nr:hypothetical protein E5206_06570 [Arthrobacter sp. PAMC25564]
MGPGSGGGPGGRCGGCGPGCGGGGGGTYSCRCGGGGGGPACGRGRRGISRVDRALSASIRPSLPAASAVVCRGTVSPAAAESSGAVPVPDPSPEASAASP